MKTHRQPSLLSRRRAVLGAVGMLGICGLPLGHAAQTPQFALVIGNDRYQHNARLRNAGRDADLVGRTLADMGADVVRLKDATAAQMREQVVAIAKRADAARAVLWVYYSGHGIQIGGKNYLQGVDADFSLPERARAQGLDLSWLTEILTRDRLPAAIVLIDACRDNPFLPSTRGLDGYGLAPIDPQGLLIGYSTAPFKKALDGRNSTNGPYAQALAKVFSQRPVELEAAMRQVATEVYQATGKQQVPWLASSLRAAVKLDAQGIRVASAPALASKPGGQMVGAQTRGAVTYRPDVADSERHSLPAEHWQRVADRLQEEMYYAKPEDARGWVAAASKTTASDEIKLLAGHVLLEAKAGQKEDLPRAMKIFLPMARKGNVLAQTLLGEAYFGMKKPDEGYRWLSLAAEIGFRRAQMSLAEATFRSDWANNGAVNIEALKKFGNAATFDPKEFIKR